MVVPGLHTRSYMQTRSCDRRLSCLPADTSDPRLCIPGCKSSFGVTQPRWKAHASGCQLSPAGLGWSENGACLPVPLSALGTLESRHCPDHTAHSFRTGLAAQI